MTVVGRFIERAPLLGSRNLRFVDFGWQFWVLLERAGFFGNRLRSLYHTTDFADWVVIPASSPRMTKWSTKMAPHETPPKSLKPYTTPGQTPIFRISQPKNTKVLKSRSRVGFTANLAKVIFERKFCIQFFAEISQKMYDLKIADMRSRNR